jgi:predicted unusual protein kinase regulating ubiquinone biosynthesis (AarF/ABC1/UbiB family)
VPHRPAAKGSLGDDDLPASRAARAAEIGRLGASLLSTMIRTGARELVSGLGGRERVVSEVHRAGASVLFASLGRLRGPAAKMGQFLAQRPGTLPDEYLESMLALTDRVPAMSATTVLTLIASELGRPPAALFAAFERTPLAAGSFGQVHAAARRDGREVAVKIQYPAVDEALESDLANLEMVLPAIERLAGRDDLDALVAELRARLTEELDYRREAESAALFRAIFAGRPIVIPEVHEDLSTRRVLTTDLLEGAPLQAYLDGAPTLADRNRAALLVLRFSFEAVLDHAVLHVDPNPGNYLFRRDGALGVVDFGCVKRFPATFPERVRTMYRAAARGRAGLLDDALVGCGLLSPEATPAERAPLRELARQWARPGLEPDFDFGDRAYLDELTRLQHQLARGRVVRIPPDWVFYARQVVGVTYLLHRLGARHRSAFIEQFQEVLAEPPAKPKKPAPRGRRATKPSSSSS